MSTQTDLSPTESQTRPRRYIPFRIVCLLEAVIYLFVFGMYRAWLTPWLTLPDSTDHGWTRTPALHRWADSAAGVFYLALIAALLVLAVRPARSSGLVAWVLMLTTATALGSGVSMVLQEHAHWVEAAGSAAIILVVLAGSLFATAPDRRAVIRGGRPAADRLGLPRGLFAFTLVGWTAVVVVSVVWRTLGGRFESPQEDDVISFLLVGAAGALGSWLVLCRREGHRPLGRITLGLTAYAIVASASLLLLA